MARRRFPTRTLPLALALVAALALAASAAPRERKRPPRHPQPMMRSVVDFDAAEVMGATVGGAKDIRYFRDRVADGEIPHPNVFTPEGLFSEHDLPVTQQRGCDALLCIAGEAVPAALLVQPEVRYLAQVGFSSGLDPRTFQRAAVNLIAVIDKSGSMSGQPLDTVKASLHHLIDQLRPDDQIAIVLYGDRVHTHLVPTAIADRAALHAQVDLIQSEGSTYLEAGLAAGFALARQTAPDFDGLTRVMLFTDERPNVGRTDAEGFIGMAEAASKAGVGMTTVGVGVQFGAELATAVSSVRGGNLFFFADVAQMEKVFREEFDTMVTELAYEMEITFRPVEGTKIAGVYGIPGSMLKWSDDGALKVRIATIFASKKKGAIYLALAAAGSDALPVVEIAEGAPVAKVELGYLTRDRVHHQDSLALALASMDRVAPGLSRGLLLVNEATALKEATRLHHEENQQEKAYQIVHMLATLFRPLPDADLANELALIEGLERRLAFLSGHQGEGPTAGVLDPVSGLPPK